MEEYIDFFNRYIVAAIQLLLGFFFFVRFLKKKGRLFFELLFVVFGSVVILAVPVGSIVEYLIYAMLLVAMGIFICHADWKSVILYAALMVDIMELSFGIVNSLSGILYPWLAPLHPNAAAAISSLLGTLSFVLAVCCYQAAYRCFLHYETTEKQYLFIILTPILIDRKSVV